MNHCFYCKRTSDSELPVVVHGKQFHVSCYPAQVHDDMVRIRAYAQSIIQLTTDNNAGANSTARFIETITENY